MKFHHRDFFLILLITLLLCVDHVTAECGWATCDIRLNDHASGGSLILADGLNLEADCVTIETFPNESSTDIAHRFVEFINKTRYKGRTVLTSSDGYIKGLSGMQSNYFFAGTEEGLGIPKAPYSLTAHYDEKNNRAIFKWRNAPGGYDYIQGFLRWEGNVKQGNPRIPGDAEEWVLNITKPYGYTDENMFSEMDLWIFGYKDDIPSNAAGIRMKYNFQEEYDGIPFASNVAPNWTTFNAEGHDNKSIAMGVRKQFVNAKYDRFSKSISGPDSKPYYQMINSDASGISGVAREFIGLNPGHKYKILIRVNTLEANQENGDWKYSVHAIPTKSNEPLNYRQLSGLEELPDGQKGSSAAILGVFIPPMTTDGKFEEVTAEITLPPDKDCITVWLRLEGGNKDTQVAMDYISLEDLGE